MRHSVPNVSFTVLFWPRMYVQKSIPYHGFVANLIMNSAVGQLLALAVFHGNGWLLRHVGHLPLTISRPADLTT